MSNNNHTSTTIHNFPIDRFFKSLPNQTAEDEYLSFNAKGLLWYITSRPSDWKVHVNQLASLYKGDQNGNGEHAIYQMLNELKDRGYVKYQKFRNDKGHWQHRYDVYPIPYQQIKKMFPDPEVPDVDLPDVENHDILPRKEVPRKEFNKNPPSLLPPENKDKSLRSEEDFAQELIDLPLPYKDKVRLSKNYTKDQVVRAIGIAKTQVVKKDLMGLLLNILKKPDEWPDNTQQIEDQKLTPEQKKALEYNEKLAKFDPEHAKTNETLIRDMNAMFLFDFTYPDGKRKFTQIVLNPYNLPKDLEQAYKILDPILRAMK